MIERNLVSAPGLDTLQALARALEISPDELFAAAGMEARPTATSPADSIADWIAALTRIAPTLTTTQRAAVLEHAEALRDRHGRGKL
jgi:transcriptional regulator with XRE-family HTH domain